MLCVHGRCRRSWQFSSVQIITIYYYGVVGAFAAIPLYHANSIILLHDVIFNHGFGSDPEIPIPIHPLTSFLIFIFSYQHNHWRSHSREADILSVSNPPIHLYTFSIVSLPDNLSLLEFPCYPGSCYQVDNMCRHILMWWDFRRTLSMMNNIITLKAR